MPSPGKEAAVNALYDMVTTVEAALYQMVRTKHMQLNWESIVVLVSECMKQVRQFNSITNKEKHAVVVGALTQLLKRDGVMSKTDKEIVDMAEDIVPHIINGLYAISPQLYRRSRRCLAGLCRR